ncbi:reverse transcriptase domain-containing protein [Tanacetum coccineum]|uniref:Reverse transcriptase domain-containing protein n=1 Tax=Tanacetum coccineum TaxID=301880 RepID=A0ABQ4ZP75_9ASTR
MQEGMFLGYKVSTNALRACPDKAVAISEMHQGRVEAKWKISKLKQIYHKSAEKSKEAISAVYDEGKQRMQANTIKYCKPHSMRPQKSTYSYGKVGVSLAHCKPEERVSGRTHGRTTSTTRVRDIVHRRLVLRRWLRGRTNTTNPEGAEFTYAMRFRFEATNNEAEYEALIAGLRIAEQMGVKNLQANVDSRLVANQVNGSYIAKESGMVQYLNKVKTLAKSFKEFSIKQIPRSENKKADALSKIASTSFAHLNKQVLVEELKEKSINEKEILDVVEEEGNTWMTPICEYLTKEILPEDKKKARAVRRKAVRFGLPRGIISDNGKQFRDNPFKDCLGKGIKAMLDEKSKDWIEELPHVLWAHRTMIKSSNGETPFSLTYGMEAVIPADIGMPTLQTAEIDQTKNNEALGINLDLIKERREQAAIQEAKKKEKDGKILQLKSPRNKFQAG